MCAGSDPCPLLTAPPPAFGVFAWSTRQCRGDFNQLVGMCWADQNLFSRNLTFEWRDVRLEQGQVLGSRKAHAGYQPVGDVLILNLVVGT